MPDNSELVSVIVPVYNGEATIGSCLDSILSQSYANLEVLVIDDGSTDGTREIVSSIAREDTRVNLIAKENGGVSSARNVGLDNMTGEYVAFVDSDDSIELDMLEVLLDAGVSTGSDVACCGFERLRNGVWVSQVDERQDWGILTREEYLLGVIGCSIGSPPIGGYLCNKLFKYSLLHRVRFDTGKTVCEDLLVVAESSRGVTQACWVPRGLYRYADTPDSATKNLKSLVTPDGKWGYFEAYSAIREDFAETERLAEALRLAQFGTALSAVYHLAGHAEYRDLFDSLSVYISGEWGFYRSRTPLRKRLKPRLVLSLPNLYHWLKLIGGCI